MKKEFNIYNLPEGYIAKTGSQDRIFIYNENDEVVGAECTVCGKILALNLLQTKKSAYAGVNSNCKECAKTYKKQRVYSDVASVYCISFPEINAVYIGQTRQSIQGRLDNHRSDALRGVHGSLYINYIAEKCPEYALERISVQNVDVLCELDKTCTDVELLNTEYNLQLEYLSEGFNVLGGQLTDMMFLKWVYETKGLSGRRRILREFLNCEEAVLEHMGLDANCYEYLGIKGNKILDL